VFQVRKWSWKRLASKLLLIPVLSGGAASVAHAQSPPASGSGAGLTSTMSPGAGATTPTDPKALLQAGRKALAAGQFDKAQDLCRAAEANNPSGKWGLFEDTPNALSRDIHAAYAKVQKAQSEQLTKQAKTLLTAPAGSDVERMANLDKALQMAQRADQLHGAYSAWDFGERADKLVKEIQAARSQLQAAGVTSTAAMPSGPAANTPSQVTPAGAMAARSMPADAKKTAALQLMSEAKKLADQGNFGQAKAKLLEADRLGATFGPSEYAPTFALNELNVRGSRAIDRLIAEAKSQMNNKDYLKAEAAINGANDVAASLSLYAKPIDDARNQLRAMSKGAAGVNIPPTVAASAKVDGNVSSDSGVAKLSSPSLTSLPAPSSEFGHAAVSGNLTAKQYLEHADIEFRKGDLDLAENLAKQAHNAGAQEEARRMLNTIDAERLKLKGVIAKRSLDSAEAAYKSKDYREALGVLVLIDPKLLSSEQKAKRDELLVACRTETNKESGSAVAVAVVGGTQQGEPPALPGLPTESQPPSASNPPGTARVDNEPRASADNVASQVDALRRVQFQKLRAEGLKTQADAQAAFGRGEPDIAIQMLLDYEGRVKSANLEPSSVAMLLRPIDSRLEMFRMMRGNQIAVARMNKDNQEAQEYVRNSRGAAEEQRKDEMKKLFAKYHALTKEQKYAEAEKVALQAKQLDPDNPACTALYDMAKLQRAHKDADKLKSDKEEMFRLGLNAAERQGPMVDIDDPVRLQLERSGIARRRGSGDSSYIRTHSPATYEIEMKLSKPISIDFNQTPLDQAVKNLQALIEIPMIIDFASLEAEGISPVKPVTVTPGSSVAAKHMLAVTLEQAGLSFVIENDMVKVTTNKKAKGRLFTKVFSVADLVTPVPNFKLPEYANFEKMMAAGTGNYGRNLQTGFGGGSAPIAPANGLANGAPTGALATMPGIGTGGGIPGIPGAGGTLQTNPFGDNRPNPLGSSTNLAPDRNTKHEQLIKLITGMVRPYSWDGMGGPGRLEYYDIGSALVVNQTADVIQEVSDLLEALRRLQDLAIAVEVRIVSLSESWFERMGVDFAVNILTNSSHQGALQTQLTQVDGNTGAAGVFAPYPYLNALGNVGATVGLTPAGTFTPDLNVPIRNSSFQMAIPPFGGYPNSPGSDGGVSLGLAFLNDLQVYLFMEAAAGDRRVNVMQAPKLTLFNGQTSTISIDNTQFFVTNVQVISVNGQIVFSPVATPFPGPGDPFNPGNVGGNTPATLSVTIQGVVSADRRFVRLNMPVNMSAQTGSTVPLFPITTFVTPVFEGGSQGQPIPFTQFLQQPAFTDLNIQTTVVCPDGGTVLLGGFKQLSEGRNEFGPPFLSDIPYLNRLFKNVGIGRDTTHIMIMVTPRIIINSEEEIFQTEGRQP
jgi:hypothetical protein